MAIARCPRPKEIGLDGGSEFRMEFLELCEDMGIKVERSNAWNPKGNAMLERVHQVFGGMLRTC